jgi:two-component system chemotaxis response regulator CheY
MAAKDIRILVVEDSSTMRRVIRVILKRLRYENVEDIAEASQALEKLKSEHFNLVICGMNLPGMSGLDLLKAVRAEPNLKELPFMMVTGEVNKEQVIEAIEAGVNSLVVKPFTEDIFSRKLELLFNHLAA